MEGKGKEGWIGCDDENDNRIVQAIKLDYKTICSRNMQNLSNQTNPKKSKDFYDQHIEKL